LIYLHDALNNAIIYLFLCISSSSAASSCVVQEVDKSIPFNRQKCIGTWRAFRQPGGCCSWFVYVLL